MACYATVHPSQPPVLCSWVWQVCQEVWQERGYSEHFTAFSPHWLQRIAHIAFKCAVFWHHACIHNSAWTAINQRSTIWQPKADLRQRTKGKWSAGIKRPNKRKRRLIRHVRQTKKKNRIGSGWNHDRTPQPRSTDHEMEWQDWRTLHELRDGSSDGSRTMLWLYRSDGRSRTHDPHTDTMENWSWHYNFGEAEWILEYQRQRQCV